MKVQKRPGGRVKQKSPAIAESVFLRAVIGIAQDGGWLVFHDEDSRRNRPGFPDLVMTREGRTIFAELKSQRGRIRPEQQRWLDELAKAPGAEVYLWRPSDLDSIVQMLMGHLLVTH